MGRPAVGCWVIFGVRSSFAAFCVGSGVIQESMSHHQGRTCLLLLRWKRQTEKWKQDGSGAAAWRSNLTDTKVNVSCADVPCFRHCMVTSWVGWSFSQTYRCLLRARSNPGTPPRCEPPPRGEAPLSAESTAAGGCLQTQTDVLSYRPSSWHTETNLHLGLVGILFVFVVFIISGLTNSKPKPTKPQWWDGPNHHWPVHYFINIPLGIFFYLLNVKKGRSVFSKLQGGLILSTNQEESLKLHFLQSETRRSDDTRSQASCVCWLKLQMTKVSVNSQVGSRVHVSMIWSEISIANMSLNK